MTEDVNSHGGWSKRQKRHKYNKLAKSCTREALRDAGRLTSGTRDRKGTSPDGAQNACTACARAVPARRAVSSVAVVERTIVRLGWMARRPSGEEGDAEV